MKHVVFDENEERPELSVWRRWDESKSEVYGDDSGVPVTLAPTYDDAKSLLYRELEDGQG
jgi:hypothetical protein